MKNKGLGILLLLLGGYYAYYLIKKKKPIVKKRGDIIVDPLLPGEFADDQGNFPSDYEFPLIPKGYTTEQISTQLNSQMQPQQSILQQIQNMKPIDDITYQTYYASINGSKKNDVPFTI